MLTTIAERVCLAIMRDAKQDPELRMSAAHVALVLQHLDREQATALDQQALATPYKDADHG